MVIGSGAWELYESKRYSYLQEGHEGGPRELLTSQPHLDPWECDGAANPGNRFQAHEGQEGIQE